MTSQEFQPRVCVIGLGYVGLPIAIAFDKAKIPTTGYDINNQTISELKTGIDHTHEIHPSDLQRSTIDYTTDPRRIAKSNFIIVTVPTPITKTRLPDLSAVKSASRAVGKYLSKETIVVFESTVYPGVTEEICQPIIEKASGLVCGRDWKIGYSPERINPGDKTHTIDKIVKIVSGMDDESAKIIERVYRIIVRAGIHVAPSIKVAEAAKLIENTQRDINIALMNELSMFFHKLGLNTYDVLRAAGTKWNFLPFTPGLVGGHCIGTDPYYLIYKAKEVGFSPKMISSGRRVNDSMPHYIVDRISSILRTDDGPLENVSVLLMGLTFKEDVPDFRNSRAKDIIDDLKKLGVRVMAYEPLLQNETIQEHFGVQGVDIGKTHEVFHVIIVINKHNAFKGITLTNLKKISSAQPILFDIKEFFNKEEAKSLGFFYHSL